MLQRNLESQIPHEEIIYQVELFMTPIRAQSHIYVSQQEESELTDYLISTSKTSYGKTRQQVLNIVQHVAKVKRSFAEED